MTDLPVKDPLATPNPTANRYLWIDAIRGLAALFVVVLHYFHIALLALIPAFAGGAAVSTVSQDTLEKTLEYYSGTLHVDTFNTLSNFILGYFDLGKVGVVVFFMISGFVIPFSLFRGSTPVRNFFISRFFRLYPVYWISLILVMLVLPDNLSRLNATGILGHIPVVNHMLGMTPMNGSDFSLASLFANFTMFHKFLLIPDLNGVAWTLQIEWLFYLTCIALMVAGLLKSTKVSAAMVIVSTLGALGMAYLRHTGHGNAPIALPLGLAVMFLGYLWRGILMDKNPAAKRAFIASGIFFVVLMPVIALIGYSDHASTYITTYGLSLLMFVTMSTVIKLESRVFGFLGEISYSVYLLHVILGRPLITAIIQWTPQLYRNTPILVLLPMIAVGLLTIGVSALMYRYVEVPAIAMGRRIIKGREGTLKAATA